VKAVSECYLPVSGKVVESNESLKETPSQINKSPYEKGIVNIEIDEENSKVSLSFFF
jgi:glycine cleavage system H protein